MRVNPKQRKAIPKKLAQLVGLENILVYMPYEHTCMHAI